MVSIATVRDPLLKLDQPPMAEAVREQGRLLSLLSQAIDGFFLLVDRDMRIQFASHAGMGWLDFSPQEMQGQTLRDVFSIQLFQAVHFCAQEGMTGEPSTFELELPFVDRKRWIQGRAIPDFDETGATAGILLLLRDITRDKTIVLQAEASRDGLIDLKDHAVQVAEEKSRFLAAASHDLRQPLHAMTLFARALSNRVDDSEAVQLVEQLQLSLQSLQHMFNSLLDLSKLDAGLIAASHVNADLSEITAPLLAELETAASERGLEFRSGLSKAIVRTDPGLMQTVLRNLLTNALKFTETGGILLAARTRSDHVLIQVYDTGPGVESDRLDAIFNEFERSRSTASGANDGLGLGLSIVARLAAVLDCTLTVRSKPGHGTCFSLRVPYALEADTYVTHSETSNVVDQSIFEGKSLVVIDDDPQVLSALTRVLEDLGFIVASAPSSGAIPDLVAEVGVPDACVLDFDLGDDTGLNAYETYKEAVGKSFPAILITASTDPKVLQELDESGLSWLTKPVDPDLLVVSLANLLEAGD